VAIVQAFQMQGGPHHGEHLDPPAASPAPDTLFAITYIDGAAYARAGERVGDAQGHVRDLFCFDSDGGLTEHAKREFTQLD
jgi:hypothetical protein